MLWAARLTPYGHDTLTYDQSRLRAEPPPAGEEADWQAMELIPSRMAALPVAEQVTCATTGSNGGGCSWRRSRWIRWRMGCGCTG
ncbi:DUF6417 family protein [Streptomyces mirabilis]